MRLDALATTRFLVLTVLVLGSVLVAGWVQPRAMGAASSFTFTAAGDYGDDSPGTPAGAVVSLVKATGPDFHLALGDLRYTSLNAQTWCQNFKAQYNNMIFITGNHESGETDYGPTDKFAQYCPFSLPGPVIPGVDPAHSYGYEYAFDYPATAPLARFILVAAGIQWACCNLTGSWNYAAGDPHYNWVANTIDDARARGIPWVIVGLHKNCLSSSNGCDSGSDLMNLLFSKKVDLYLVGHDHSYQRSYQLSCGDPNQFLSSCVVSTSSTMAKGAGTEYVIQGTGGEGNSAVCTSCTEAPYFASMMYSDFGVMKYTVSATSLTGTYLSATGSFTDSFSIGAGALTGSFNYSPSAVQIGDIVSFTGSSFGGLPPYSYSWDFGDGNTGTGLMVSHSYSSAGAFTVVFRVTDANAKTVAASQTVTVLVSLPLIASFSYSPTLLGAGQAVTFTGAASGGKQPYSFSWSFGDQASGTGNPVSHVYNAAGTYSVALTARDGLNSQASSGASVVVASSTVLTSFQFSDPGGNDVTSKVSWEVWQGYTMVGTGSPVSLYLSKVYLLKGYYESYLVGGGSFAPTSLVRTTLYLYGYNATASEYVAFDGRVSSFSVGDSSAQRLVFTASGTAASYRMIVRVPRIPVKVSDDGTGVAFLYNSARGVVVVDTQTLGTWDFEYQSAAQPPPSPPSGPVNRGCSICVSLTPSQTSYLWLLGVGGLIGITSSIVVVNAKARGRLERARKPRPISNLVQREYVRGESLVSEWLAANKHAGPAVRRRRVRKARA